MTPSSRLIECVPNFSEGRSEQTIGLICEAIGSVGGVQLLHVDPGQGAHRTVVTFAGAPEAVAEAAFRGASRAAQLIDMRRHHGTHPRQGATDVLPLVPVSGVGLDECAALARRLAQRLATEAGIPCYAYEAAALRPDHRNLADCRAGEYEALSQKLLDERRRPDYLPHEVQQWLLRAQGSACPPPLPAGVQRSGFTVVGARPFLVAVNFNLDTPLTDVARAVAAQVRQRGPADRPSALPGVKAIGWHIPEYGIAQVSVNLTDIVSTPLHRLYEAVSEQARALGARVTGTEIVGLVPLQVLTAAGRHFLGLGEDSPAAPEATLVQAAVDAMGLDDLRPFEPRRKVIEYLLQAAP